MTQKVKNLTAMQETWEDSSEEDLETHFSFLVCRNPMDRGAWRASVYGVSEWDTSEGLSTHMHIQRKKENK